MASIDELADIEAIKRLKSRYFYHLDRKDWQGWRDDVFAPDAALLTPEAQADAVEGIDAIVEFVSSHIAAGVTVHHGHMPDIELTGSDTARGRWGMEDVIHWPADAPNWAGHTYLYGFGFYEETYVRTAGGWRIETLLLTRLHLEMR